MPSCAFPKCTNNTTNANKTGGFTFHSFPKEVDTKQKWIKAIRKARHDDFWMWNKYVRICSEHFLPSEIYHTKKGLRKIKKNAVPKVQLQNMELSTTTTQSNVPRRQSGADSSCSSVSVDSSEFDTPRKADLKHRKLFLSSVESGGSENSDEDLGLTSKKCEAEGPAPAVNYVEINVPQASGSLVEPKESTSLAENDEIDIFTTLLAVRLRRLDAQVTAKLRDQIHNLVYLAECQQYEDRLKAKESAVIHKINEQAPMAESDDDPLSYVIKIEEPDDDM